MKGSSMTAKSAANLRRPAGLTPDQEARWWDAHPEYWDQRASPADEVLHPEHTPPVRRTRPISLRLPIDLIDALKREAALRDLPYQTLIRVWLREQLDRYSATSGPSASGAPPAGLVSHDAPVPPRAHVAETKAPYRSRARSRARSD